MDRIKVAAAFIASSDAEQLLPIKELLSVIVASPEGHYVGSESESAASQGDQNSEATNEIMGRTGLEDPGGYEEFEEERRREIEEGRQCLAALHAQYQKELDQAFANQAGAKGVKRGYGDEEAKEKPDAEMQDQSETKVLTPLQVVEANKARIKREADGIRQLERISAKEVVLVKHVLSPNALVLVKAKKDKQKGNNQGDATGSAGMQDETRQGAKASASAENESCEAEGGGVQPAQKAPRAGGRKPHPPIEVQLEMLMQERMQKQQEVERLSEISRVQRMAVVQTAVRKAASEIEKARAVPY